MKYKIKETNIKKLKLFLKKIKNNKIKKTKNGDSI
tara:strand:+ start:2097 stop:2201 length:105 start_codon:yes stop_codon:yes gene_type:complete